MDEVSDRPLLALLRYPAFLVERSPKRFQGHWIEEAYTCSVYNGEIWSGQASAPTLHEAVNDAIQLLNNRVETKHLYDKKK